MPATDESGVARLLAFAERAAAHAGARAELSHRIRGRDGALSAGDARRHPVTRLCASRAQTVTCATSPFSLRLIC